MREDATFSGTMEVSIYFSVKDVLSLFFQGVGGMFALSFSRNKDVEVIVLYLRTLALKVFVVSFPHAF